MLHRIESVGVKAHGINPVGPDFFHLLPDVRRLGFEVVEREQFAQLHLRGIRPVLRGAVVVENVGQVRVSVNRGDGSRIKGRGVLTPARIVAEAVAIRRVDKVRPIAVATVHPRAAVVYHHVIDDEQAALLRLANQPLQILEGTETRVDIVKIGRGIAVIIKVAIGILQHRREPDRRGAQRFDVVELALDADPVAAMRLVAHRRICPAVEVIVGRVAVEKPVGDDLVDVLVAPKIRIGCRRKVRIAGQHDAVDVQPSVAHPKIQRVGSGGRNIQRDRCSGPCRRVPPGPSIELLHVDAHIGETGAVKTYVHSRAACIAGKPAHPDVIGAGIAERNAVVDLRAGRFPS